MVSLPKRERVEVVVRVNNYVPICLFDNTKESILCEVAKGKAEKVRGKTLKRRGGERLFGKLKRLRTNVSL